MSGILRRATQLGHILKLYFEAIILMLRPFIDFICYVKLFNMFFNYNEAVLIYLLAGNDYKNPWLAR